MFISKPKSQLVLALCAGLAFSACSKKKKTDGEVAGDTAVQTTEVAPTVGAGQKIPELATVYFEFDSFELTADAKAKIDANAAWLKGHANRAVQVEGHCDERGTTEYNLALGERRAGVVKDALVARGVPATQLSTISYGEERPAVNGSDEYAWSQNRRAEFVSQ